MKKSRVFAAVTWGVFFLVAPLLAGCQRGHAASIPEAWAPMLTFDDAVTIDNGVVRLSVSPAAGRVVEFGLVNGENLIWVNTLAVYDEPVVGNNGQKYYNLGGDKLWPAPQPLWGFATGNGPWPPEGVIDGQAWALVDQTDDALTIESRPSPHFGIVVRRQFELSPDAAEAVITNTIRRVEANPFPVQVWTITQVTPPLAAVLDVAGDRPAVGPDFLPLTDDTPDKIEGHVRTSGPGGAAVWSQRGEPYAKLGSLGRWVAATYDGIAFRQETSFDPHGAYPEGSSVQVYRAADYTELELLGPLVQLAPGESVSNTVKWSLITSKADLIESLIARDPD